MEITTGLRFTTTDLKNGISLRLHPQVGHMTSNIMNLFFTTYLGSGETLGNPCDKWFCTPAKMQGGTQVFATRWDQSSTTVYPMAWDLDNKEVPGINMTDYYQDVCNKC